MLVQASSKMQHAWTARPTLRKLMFCPCLIDDQSFDVGNGRTCPEHLPESATRTCRDGPRSKGRAGCVSFAYATTQFRSTFNFCGAHGPIKNNRGVAWLHGLPACRMFGIPMFSSAPVAELSQARLLGRGPAPMIFKIEKVPVTPRKFRVGRSWSKSLVYSFHFRFLGGLIGFLSLAGGAQIAPEILGAIRCSAPITLHILSSILFWRPRALSVTSQACDANVRRRIRDHRPEVDCGGGESVSALGRL